jgi:hypothetical protein
LLIMMAVLPTLDDLVKTANPETKVIIIHGAMGDDRYKGIYSRRNRDAQFERYPTDWYFEDLDGPNCHLCKKQINSLLDKFTYQGNVYYKMYTGSLTIENQRNDGFLQCSYCFNFFHRSRCSLTMSDESYCKATQSRAWSCPTCVPEFRPTSSNNNKRKKKNHQGTKDPLVELFRALHKFKIHEIKIANFDDICKSVINYLTNPDQSLDYG